MEQGEGDKIAEFVGLLNDRSEVFAFLTPGTLRVRCAYVRAREKAPWWRFERGAEPTRVEPVRDTARPGIADRPVVFWGPLSALAALHAESDRPALAALLYSARDAVAVATAGMSASKGTA